MDNILNLTRLNDEWAGCRKCTRLVAWREQVAQQKRRAYRDIPYWSKPVPGFGDPQASVLAVGLAPGAHGSNRTGRMFTGDASGDFLYSALFRAGFCNQPHARHVHDGLLMRDLFISAVCRCAPPGNKPTGEEVVNCLPYLVREMEIIRPKIIVALGQIAHVYLSRILRPGEIPGRFIHASCLQMKDGRWMVSSYHPSQQNTQTGRLTAPMFDDIWTKVKGILDE